MNKNHYVLFIIVTVTVLCVMIVTVSSHDAHHDGHGSYLCLIVNPEVERFRLDSIYFLFPS